MKVITSMRRKKNHNRKYTLKKLITTNRRMWKIIIKMKLSKKQKKLNKYIQNSNIKVNKI
jgi:hypothetical protein